MLSSVSEQTTEKTLEHIVCVLGGQEREVKTNTQFTELLTDVHHSGHVTDVDVVLATPLLRGDSTTNGVQYDLTTPLTPNIQVNSYYYNTGRIVISLYVYT